MAYTQARNRYRLALGNKDVKAFREVVKETVVALSGSPPRLCLWRSFEEALNELSTLMYEIENSGEGKGCVGVRGRCCLLTGPIMVGKTYFLRLLGEAMAQLSTTVLPVYDCCLHSKPLDPLILRTMKRNGIDTTAVMLQR